jgi:hypothetical protein
VAKAKKNGGVKMGFGGWPNHPQGLGHPILAKGVVGATPDFHLLFSIFIFFLEKKKKKRRSNAQNDIVLGWVGVVVLEPKTV